MADVGVTESHVPLLLVETAAVTARPPPELLTETVCAGGAVAPAAWENVSELGDTDIDPAVTWKVIGMVSGLSATAAPPCPVAVMTSLPV